MECLPCPDTFFISLVLIVSFWGLSLSTLDSRNESKLMTQLLLNLGTISETHTKCLNNCRDFAWGGGVEFQCQLMKTPMHFCSFQKEEGCLPAYSCTQKAIKDFNNRARLSLLRNYPNQSQIPGRAPVAPDSDKVAHNPSSPTMTARCLMLGLNIPKVDRQR